jgi:hypothetical protein
MSTTDDTTQPAPAAEVTEPTTEQHTEKHIEQDTEAKPGSSEAARYRRRLREAEANAATITAERDALRERLTARLQADAESLAKLAGLHDGRDLWHSDDATLDDLLDNKGQVDPSKVAETVAGIVAARPHWRRPVTNYDGGARVGPGTGTPTWSDLLKGSR